MIHLSIQSEDLSVAGVEERIRQLIPTIERTGDLRTLAKAWKPISLVHLIRGETEAARHAIRNALRYAREAGDHWQEVTATEWLGACYMAGEVPCEQGIRELSEEIDKVERLTTKLMLMVTKGCLIGISGDPEEGRRLTAESREMIRQLGNEMTWAGSGQAAAHIETLNGNHDSAIAILEVDCASFERLGEKSLYSTSAGLLAEILCRAGRFEDAERWALKGKELGLEDDALTQILWRSALAQVLAARGESAEAQRLISEAVDRAEASDMLTDQGSAHAAHARVLTLLGREDDARHAWERALECYARKGCAPEVQRISALLGSG
jgi:ATP/maltotriose-dependent transcriptional regulator MalT